MSKLLLALLLVPLTVLADDHTIFPKGVSQNVQVAQLCIAGYTKTIRPPVSYTNKHKVQWTPAGQKPNEYELDHYIPLQLGGSPTDPNNLWMQTWDTARRKDIAESYLHRQMCKGVYTLAEAQEKIRNWK